MLFALATNETVVAQKLNSIGALLNSFEMVPVIVYCTVSYH